MSKKPEATTTGPRVRHTITAQNVRDFNGGACRRCGCKDVRHIRNANGERKTVCRFCAEPVG